MFLRHEGFLGALGAFMNYKDGNADLMPLQLVEQTPKSSSCIVDRIHNSTRVHENESGALDCRLRVSSSFKIYDEVKRCWPKTSNVPKEKKIAVVSCPDLGNKFQVYICAYMYLCFNREWNLISLRFLTLSRGKVRIVIFLFVFKWEMLFRVVKQLLIQLFSS